MSVPDQVDSDGDEPDSQAEAEDRADHLEGW
jgi:hypothetical protein